MWVILASFLIALCLMVMPLPHGALWYRPEFLLLVLIYWVIAVPDRVGIICAWCLGFLLDVISGSLLGVHGLGYAVAAYIALLIYQRMRMFSLLQQSLVVMMLVLIANLIVLWGESLTQPKSLEPMLLMSILTSGFLWSVIFLTLRSLRRRYHVVQ